MQTKDILGTRYCLEQRIAVGGMGDVWVARDELLGRRVALKLLHPFLAADDGFRQRFRAEAKAAARLSHPGIVAVYDYGEEADAAYLAMELVEGEPLSSVLARRGRLGPGEAMSLVTQAADALAAAHAEGLVHRDVKPANLLVRPDGRVKVTDFGIVRAVGTATMTTDGTVLGTVAYMSPEQVRGERVTAASDIYSLGVVAYECLSGARPFAGDESIAVALAHLHDPVPSLPGDVPAPVRRLVLAMLEKNPGARPSSAAAVADTARRLAAATPFAADPTALEGAAVPGGAPASLEDGPPTETLYDLHLTDDDVTGTLALAGLAQPPTLAVRPPRPIPRRLHAPRVTTHRWVPVGALSLVALLIAIVLAASVPSAPARAGARHTVTLPSVTGLSLSSATHRLVADGLRVSTGPNDPSPIDVVVAETPRAGTRVTRGATVLLATASPSRASAPSAHRTLSAQPTPTTTTTSSPAPRAHSASGGPAPGPPPPGDGPPGHGHGPHGGGPGDH